jgi:plastocyanin
MKKSVIGITIAVLSLGLIGFVVFAGNNEGAEDRTSQQTTQSLDEGRQAMDMPATGTQESETSSQEPTNTTNASTVSVAIEDFAFSPSKLTIKKGTTVTWTNKDTARHDVTPDNETADFKASKLLAKGESYSVTFNSLSTYTYICSPHPYMQASVEVVE